MGQPGLFAALLGGLDPGQLLHVVLKLFRALGCFNTGGLCYDERGNLIGVRTFLGHLSECSHNEIEGEVKIQRIGRWDAGY